MRVSIVFLLLLIPSALYVWKNPDMPEFGRLHDDGLLFVSAKGLADGDGFRILSLPQQPAQTKYPVFYPLYLSLVWKLNPQFPANLWLARLFSWFLLVICLALSWIYLRKEGFSETKTMILVALLGLNPYVILFGTNTFSEVFFLCWLLAVFLLARLKSVQMAILAGVAAGCAYLARTAGIALLVSMPAWYIWRRESRRAMQFAAGMAPLILGWMWWSRNHIVHTTDQTLIYYTDYVKMELLTVGFDNWHIVLWKNIDGLLYGMGSLALPQIFAILPVKILTQVVGVAMISGIVRLFRRGIAVQYCFFAVISCAMLIVWHFPPNERFVLPLCPLLLAGLLTEIEFIAKMLQSAFRHKDIGQRVVAAGMATVLGAILLAHWPSNVLWPLAIFTTPRNPIARSWSICGPPTPGSRRMCPHRRRFFPTMIPSCIFIPAGAATWSLWFRAPGMPTIMRAPSMPTVTSPPTAAATASSISIRIPTTPAAGRTIQKKFKRCAGLFTTTAN